MQFPLDKRRYRFRDKKGCGHAGSESQAGNWRASLIEALVMVSPGAPFYTPSVTCIISALTSPVISDARMLKLTAVIRLHSKYAVVWGDFSKQLD